MRTDSGFYKLDNGSLLFGETDVQSAEFDLMRELKDTYTYPVHGWYWFDTREEAKTFFNYEDPVLPEPLDLPLRPGLPGLP